MSDGLSSFRASGGGGVPNGRTLRMMRSRHEVTRSSSSIPFARKLSLYFIALFIDVIEEQPSLTQRVRDVSEGFGSKVIEGELIVLFDDVPSYLSLFGGSGRIAILVSSVRVALRDCDRVVMRSMTRKFKAPVVRVVQPFGTSRSRNPRLTLPHPSIPRRALGSLAVAS